MVGSIGKFYTSGTKSLTPPATLKLFRTVRRAGHDAGVYSGDGGEEILSKEGDMA
jgi:hypothetical protein